MMQLADVFRNAIVPALTALPASMASARGVGMVLSIGLQETRFLTRVQLGNGPARSFWQFEQNGVKGVLNHPNSMQYATMLAKQRGIQDVTPVNVWNALATDDVLGAGFARLLLWTDPYPLPALTDPNAGWALYQRCWRPGKPRPAEWGVNFQTAVSFLESMQ